MASWSKKTHIKEKQISEATAKNTRGHDAEPFKHFFFKNVCFLLNPFLFECFSKFNQKNNKNESFRGFPVEIH